jgi:hypothetical protein
MKWREKRMDFALRKPLGIPVIGILLCSRLLVSEDLIRRRLYTKSYRDMYRSSSEGSNNSQDYVRDVHLGKMAVLGLGKSVPPTSRFLTDSVGR